jgi:pimeloyl-ACP methyl ester carboxylesterase
VKDIPPTQYVDVGDAEVAYKVIGDGPVDLVWFYGLGGHVDLIFDEDFTIRVHDALSSFCRQILFDRRGTGASRSVGGNPQPTWEEWSEDVAAVMDAADSQRAAIYAGLDAGPIAMLFAVTQPERVSALVLSNTTARYSASDDYPIGLPQELIVAAVDSVRSGWGTEAFARAIVAPRGPDFASRLARRMRASGTPKLTGEQLRYIMETLDVRPVLSLIQAPTLVLHKTDSSFLPLSSPLHPLAHGQYLAAHIPNARLVEIPGHGMDWDDSNIDVVIDEIGQFLTGQRQRIDIDRVGTTILFTDIVGSTEQAAMVGDRAWRSLLDSHDRFVREQVRHFRGREINTTGDGFVASFDGPARAIRCAAAITEAIEDLGISVRTGLHR